MPYFLALIVAASVFMHGQMPGGHKYKGLVRISATVIVTAAITYASWILIPVWYITLVASASTARAFTWGPEIGWDKDVLKTQALKAFWLTWPVFPFGIPYVILRPLSYWVGYTQFNNRQDEIARLLSAVFLSLSLLALL